MIQQLFSIGVSAGTEINHIAYLDYMLDSISMHTRSNKLTEIVDQKLDVEIICQESTNLIVEAEDKRVALKFKLTNNGNGEDTYYFSPIKDPSSNFNVLNIETYKDEGDEVFSELNDTLVEEIKLLEDESATLFFVSDIPKDAKKMSINGFKIDSLLQEDLVYGDVKKVKNFYAVVATQEESRSDFCTYEVPSIVLELEKSSTLSSAELYKGSTIHYEIAVKAIGVGRLENIVVQDDIPIGTTYVKNSLKLDGSLVDGFTGKSIAVEIGTLEQMQETDEVLHRVTFDVKVQ